jgi:hypothetical protein
MLESKPDMAAQRAAATEIFGAAGRRIPWLTDAVAKARGLATLRAIDANPIAIAGGDARAALDAARPAFNGLSEQDRKRILESLPVADARRGRIEALGDESRDRAVADLVLQGLFGPRGPGLYATAVAKEEGVDHAWVFRYETDAAGL